MWKFLLAMWFLMYGIITISGVKWGAFFQVSGTLAMLITLSIVIEETHWLKQFRGTDLPSDRN